MLDLDEIGAQVAGVVDATPHLAFLVEVVDPNYNGSAT